MVRERMTLSGRDDELSELDEALRGVTAHRHMLAVVRGTPGVGKSALLNLAAQRWRAEGAGVLEISFRDAVPEWDSFGVNAVIAALKAQFEQTVDFGLAELINAVSKLCAPESYDSPRMRSALLIGLAKIFVRLRRAGRLVVIADDVDAVTNPTLAITPACQPGCLVVAACRDDGRFAAAPVQLAQLADRLIDLGPLADEHVDTLLGKRAGAVPDDSLRAALAHALGPLVSDPGTLLSTVDKLRAEGRIRTVHGKACLADEEVITLPAEHDLLDQVHRLGAAGREVMVLAATGPAFGIDDLPVLAAATGHELNGYGRAVDTLVAVGALICTETGQLSPGCPALAESLLREARPAAARLHATLAAHLLETGGEVSAIADHLAESGRETPPSAELARLLTSAAENVAATEPERAARWYHTALWHWGNDDAGRGAALAELIRLHTSTGHFGLLASLLEEYPEAAECEQLPDKALLSDPLAWHADRLTGDTLAVTGLLPDGYGVPADGPLAHYHRVVSGYANGEWQHALSAARELTLAAPPDSLAYRIGALLAAEMCVWLGEVKQASAWLAASGEDERLTALRSWVRTGLLAVSGEGAEALASGWWALRQQVSADMIGTERLLSRLAGLAMHLRQDERANEVLAAVAALNTRHSTLLRRAALLFARGVVTADEASLRKCAELAREHGGVADLLTICFVLGEVSPQPRPWLYEAHELAARIGSAPLRAKAKAIMRRRGVPMPRTEGDRTAFSPMELKIIDLIRDGRTNRQIAVSLRITEKTVEYYLSRLFGKTGCRSRIDLAAASARGQLTAVSA